MTTLTIVITVLAAALFGAFVLLGAWIDGRRQKILEGGRHPVTTPEGNVQAQETRPTQPGQPHDTAPQDIH